MIAKTCSSADLIARILLRLTFFALGLNALLNFSASPALRVLAVAFITSHYVLFVSAVQLVAGVLLLINQFIPVEFLLVAAAIANMLADQFDEPFEISLTALARHLDLSPRSILTTRSRYVPDCIEQHRRFWDESLCRLQIHLSQLQAPNIEWSQLK